MDDEVFEKIDLSTGDTVLLRVEMKAEAPKSGLADGSTGFGVGASNDARVPQSTNPLQAGRGCEGHGRRQFLVAHPRILLQMGQQFAVDSV